MRRIVLLALTLSLYCCGAFAARLPVPYPTIDSPVVHSGKYHILTCGKTSVVLDGSSGMSIAMIQYGGETGSPLDDAGAVLRRVSAHAAVRTASGETELDQAHDPAARLQIIDQGPGRVAARSSFTLCSKDGIPFGSGTVDLYVYSDRVMLVPSLYIDYAGGETTIASAGLRGILPGDRAEIMLTAPSSWRSRGSDSLPSATHPRNSGSWWTIPGILP
jgi:hypothetical protein